MGRLREYISLFKMSEAHTTLSQIKEGRKSTYFIDSYVYNEDMERLEFEVTCDDGNYYTGIIDDRNQSIRVLYYDDDTLRVVRYRFKKVW